MITKQQFKKLLKAIKDEEKRICKLEKILDEVAVESYIILNRTFINNVIDVLEEHFTDGKTGYISWWLFEDVEKKIWENGNENEPTDVSTPDKFYDFLVRIKGEKNEKIV